MKAVAFVLCAASLAVACVDGKTPDCTSVDSGCFPGDTGTTPPLDSGSDASDAADGSTVPDAPIG